MSKETKKFLFSDNNFDEPTKPKEPELPPPPTFSESELEAARQSGYAAGHEEGKKEGLAEAYGSIEQEISQKISVLSVNFQALMSQEVARFEYFEKNVIHLTLSMFRKLYPSLDNYFNNNGIQDFIEKVVEEKRTLPSISITSHSRHVNALEKLIESKALDMKVEIVSDDQMDVSDVKVSWAEGGAERYFSFVREAVEQALLVQLERMTGDDALLDMGSDGQAQQAVTEEESPVERDIEAQKKDVLDEPLPDANETIGDENNKPLEIEEGNT